MNSIRRLARAMAAAAALAIGAGAALGQTFTSSGAITIPTFGPATPYPSVINVSGVTQPIRAMQVVLTGLSHTWPADIDMLLVGPGGQTAVIFSDVGGNGDIVSQEFILTDGFPALGTGQLTGGVFTPTNLDGGADGFSSPAPAAGPNASLSVFNGLSANGTWTLYVTDDTGSDGGSLASWSLRFNDAYSIPAQPATELVTYQGKLENAGA
ncbi:MAG: proprotein convertase P-domain-containing protein, partial [Phycisphaerales bacterium]|nr:proprotein convertase P-domain-containing protein [Phycisphaerales bacterium]